MRRVALLFALMTASPAFAGGPQGGCPDVAPPLASVPKPAKHAHQDKTDTVYVLAVVSDTGSVCSARAVTGSADERKEAEDAVRTWKFSPGRQGGRPVAVGMLVQMQFRKNAKGEVSPEAQPSDPPKSK